MSDEFCMLADEWDGKADLSGWIVSEKLDGVRARWDGHRLLTRKGNIIRAPDWFTVGLPRNAELDGELWIKRNYFNATAGIVNRSMPRIGGLEWKAMRFYVFDAPSLPLPAESRLENIKEIVSKCKFALPVQHVKIPSNPVLLHLLLTVLERGGEGLMAIDPRAGYAAGRSHHFLKVKVWKEAEATVILRHFARQSIRCRLSNGVEFDLGLPSFFWQTRPPKLGELVTFRYWQYDAKTGVPRHPTLKGVRNYE